MRVGVLALQGDVREHQAILHTLGAETVWVRRTEDLENLDGLVIPGGESTAISKLIGIFNLVQPLRDFVATKPVLGTCAGLILLSESVEGRLDDQELIGGLDIVSSRNAYGSQANSFEAIVEYENATEPVAFIRAPKILDTKKSKVLATYQGQPVAVQQDNILAACYHPEITGSTHLHSLLITEIDSRQ
ncbi:MAG TPA: pyridoxal 5'-phosphate synthase glutaminase subunit PdxT [Aquiluna sp.]